MIASTKQVRNLVRKYFNENLYSHTYTDKSNDPSMRLVTFRVDTENLVNFKKDVKVVMFLAGFENNIKVTHSRAAKYLRIKASVA
jgi:hypothetical protein